VITLIGATTENPYFEVNSALLSRSQVYELEPLTVEELETGRAARVRQSSVPRCRTSSCA
jgi:replication-associated recombination protein RarA